MEIVRFIKESVTRNRNENAWRWYRSRLHRIRSIDLSPILPFRSEAILMQILRLGIIHGLLDHHLLFYNHDKINSNLLTEATTISK